MVDDLGEAVKSNSSLTNISVEKTDSNYDVRKLTKLSNFLWSGQSHEWLESCTREDRLESSCHFSLNCVSDLRSELEI